jgi:NTP pyrophosphatase (non-canonical NTP hydrolase)
MNSEEYQKATHTTAIYPEHNALEYLTIGIGGEVGELQGKIAKLYRKDVVGGYYYRRSLNDPLAQRPVKLSVDAIEDIQAEGIKAELGDVLWFVSEFCTLFGWTLSELMEENIQKLQGRKERGTIEGSGDSR